MDEWVDLYREQAIFYIESGFVRDIVFSGGTYQIEVYDPESQESRWPFLHFEEKTLKDAFCSCPLAEKGCVHLAAAYHKVFDGYQLPLHIRFEHSFWNHLCKLFGAVTGYDERCLHANKEGSFSYDNDVHFSIQGKTLAAKKHLNQLILKRPKESPENSIKFSNFSQEEIGKWREGRPSPDLRYTLSFWSDLAKWMMQEAANCIFSYAENDEGYPTIFTLEFPSFNAGFEIRTTHLAELIPSLETVESGLKIFQPAEDTVKGISFDPQEIAFHIEHSQASLGLKQVPALPLPGWDYLKGMGFYPKNGKNLLSRTIIPKNECEEFIEAFTEQIRRYIPIHEEPLSVSYSMHFDKEWNWHFTAHLLKKGDLQTQGAVLLKHWAYTTGKGFYRVEDVLFSQPENILPPSQVSNFINHHRIWLNSQEGFQTHLSSIESYLGYTVTDDLILRFHTKTPRDSSDMMDFGDWIYYSGQGFFSKKHARLGLMIRPGLEVASEQISSFIKANREELESIPGFFTTNMPLISRGLEISVLSSTSLQVKPVYKTVDTVPLQNVHVFGDFCYLQGEGFCELPISLRLPDRYLKPLIFSQTGLALFFESELPSLKKYIQKIDPALVSAHKMDLAVDYLVRSGTGGLRAQLHYQSEYGKVAVTTLLDALQHKRRYCFTEAGLIDLQDPLFQWMRHYKQAYNTDTQTLELSTLELIRLDASFSLLAPTQETPIAQITRNLLKELREFSSHDTPNLKGLKSELRLYQQTGVQWLWFLYKNGLSGLLCDDMGLGKTHQAMALIAATLNQKTNEMRRYLVVCPTSVIYHWQDKLEVFLPHVKVHTFHGMKRSLKKLPKEGVILTSYGILRLEKKRLEEIPFEVAIFDEVQIAKNPHSRVHDALKNIRSRMRVGLTGTPIENNLRELKALFDIVLPGYMPGETRFRELFINPIERDLDEEKKALLTQMIRPFVLRRRKIEVLQELPEKSEDLSYCELSEDQVKLYKEALTQSRDALITDLRDQTTPINFIHIFSLLSYLKQVCNHPALVHKDPKNYKAYSSGKWDLFVELLEEARESDQKVVVFSQYLYMLDIIEGYLKEKGWGYAQIRGDTVDRREELRRFQEDPNCVVFIGSLQAAGLGIDLTAASVVILYDRWWNAARENQAIDRVHRIGQKWGVQVYKLITKNTIEEKIDRMIHRKGRLLEEIITADDQSVLKKFTRSELIDLLTFTEGSRE